MSGRPAPGARGRCGEPMTTRPLVSLACPRWALSTGTSRGTRTYNILFDSFLGPAVGLQVHQTDPYWLPVCANTSDLLLVGNRRLALYLRYRDLRAADNISATPKRPWRFQVNANRFSVRAGTTAVDTECRYIWRARRGFSDVVLRVNHTSVCFVPRITNQLKGQYYTWGRDPE